MEAVFREDLEQLRKSLKTLGIVVAEVDLKLRYVWIDNPHPDFDVAAVIGKRDDELIPEAEAELIMSFKREALASGRPVQRTFAFNRSDGLRYYTIFGYPLRGSTQRIEGVITVGFDTKRPDGLIASNAI